MPDEEPGLLGHLPRSRPGTRSDKRDSAAEAKAPDSGSVQSKAPAKGTPGSTKATGRGSRAGSRPAKTPAKGTPRAQKTPAKGTSPAETAPTGSAKAKQVPVSVAEPAQPASGRDDRRSSGPLRSAAKVAGTGLRVAEGVTREVLRRLPRP